MASLHNNEKRYNLKTIDIAILPGSPMLLRRLTGTDGHRGQLVPNQFNYLKARYKRNRLCICTSFYG